MNIHLKPQSRIRKDSIVAEFYHQAKLAGFDITVAYRDYDISNHTIEAVIHRDKKIICFVKIRNNVVIRGIIPVYHIKSIAEIPELISQIKRLSLI